MTNFLPLSLLASLAAFSMAPMPAGAQGAAPCKISEGKMVYAANGKRLAPVYRVNADGSVALIMAGRLLTIPATILSDVNGKLTASQTRVELLR